MARTKIDYTLLAPFTTTFIGMGRNRAINGDMRISQRNAANTATVAAAGVGYGPDMFIGTSSGTATGVFTLQQSTSTPPTGFTNYVRVNVTTADASIAAGDVYSLRTDMEGSTVRDFLLGSASAKTLTFSFQVRSSLTGTYSGAIQNGAQNRSYPFEYTINSANTWESKSVTLVGDTTGTWLTDNGVGFRIQWSFAVGTTFQGTVNTWSGSFLFGTSNQVNFMSSNSSRTWDLTGVQLEIGSVPTLFEYRPAATELLMCQRYYEKTYEIDTAIATNTATNTYFVMGAQVGATTVQYGSIPYKVPKRASPTITLYRNDGTTGSWAFTSTAGASTNRTVTAAATSTNAFLAEQTAALEYRGSGHWVADASL